MLDGLLDDILANRTIRLCAMGELVAKLSKPDRAILETVLTNQDVNASEIRRVLANRGLMVPTEAVRRHRRRQQGNGCSCP